MYFTNFTSFLLALALTGCAAGGGSMPNSRDESSVSRISLSHERATDSTAGYQHGAETESGIPVMVTDGTMHIMFPSSATIVRSASGVEVTSHGRTRHFSPAAFVTQAGTYHHFAPVAH